MKQLLITSVLATTLASGSVLANPAAQQGDLDRIFAAPSKAGQVAALSHQEMHETEGAFGVPGALVGGGAGAIGYAYTWAGNPRMKWSWADFGAHTAIGAASGALLGPAGVGRTIAAYGVTGAGSYGYSRWSSSRR